MHIITDFSVRVSHSGHDCNVIFIMNQVLLPDFYGFMKLVKGLKTVGQAKQRIVVPWVIRKAALIKKYCVPEIPLLPVRVSHSHKSIVVILRGCQDLRETLDCVI